MVKGNKIMNMGNTKIISRADVKALGRIMRQRDGIKTPTVSRLAAKDAFDRHLNNYDGAERQAVINCKTDWIAGYGGR